MQKSVLLFLFLFSASLFSQQSDFPKLSGPYLGQKPPGMTPEIFGPGLISTDGCYECCRAISPDGKELYFVRQLESGDNKIFRITEEKEGWTEPEMIQYSDQAFQYTPFISSDGKQFVFMAGQSRPKRGSSDSLPEVWILSRKGNEWTAPVSIGTSIGGAQPFYITMTESGTLYFSCMDRYGIYKSELEDGEYSPAEKLPDEINHLQQVNHPYIAPDESYLIVDARNDGDTGKDLYISFRKKDGTWIKAVSIGNKINSADHEMCPSVSNDGKYIFFGRGAQGKKTDIYWVSSRIIEDFRPKKEE